MPKINEMVPSRFLKKEEIDNEGRGSLVTISGVQQADVAMAGAEPNMKWCLDFKELEKPLVLGTTTMRQIEAALGSDDTDDWVGKQVVLYNDTSVVFGGKVTGGIRVRKSNRPQPGQAQAQPAIPPGGYKQVPAQAPQQQMPTDEIPF